MKSERGVRHEHTWFILTTDLIIHHGIMNISNQTTEFICILWIVKETFSIPLLGQQLEFLENVLQFSTNYCLSNVNFNLAMYGLTFPIAFSSFLPCHCLEEQVYRVR